MRVLVAIVNWNNAQDTLECLDSMYDQLTEHYTVLLIDNNSMDIGYLESLYEKPNIVVIKNKTNLGFTGASNQAFQYADSENFDYLVFVNNDAAVASDFIKELNTVLVNEKPDMISMQILRQDQPEFLDNVGHQMINTGEIVPIGHNEKASQYSETMHNMGSCAAGTVYSIEMVRDIGYYDNQFKTGYEDAEYGVRAVVAGYSSVYYPNLKLKHKISQSVKKVDDTEYRIEQQMNIYYSYFKLMPLTIILLNIPFILIKYLIVLLVELILFKWSYIGIHFKSWALLIKNRHNILEARRKFMRGRELLPAHKLLAKQKFFLSFDAQRFIRYVLKSQANVFDKSTS